MTNKSTQKATKSQLNRLVDTDISQYWDTNYNPIDGYEDLTVLTLEEAVKPLSSFVPDILNLVNEAKQKCVKDSSPLTLEESAAIYLYTMSTDLFTRLNQTLRAKSRRKLKPWFGFLKLFMTGIKKLPAVRDFLFRGVNGNVTNGFSTNKTEIWWSINSCTADMSTAQAFWQETGTLFTISCRTGRNIMQYSAYPHEREVILLPGTRFQIRSEPMNHKNSLYVVHLEEESAETTAVTDPASNLIPQTAVCDMQEIIYPDGSNYVGELKNGKRHGHGVHYYKDKSDYTGQWVNDKKHGRGIRTYSNGNRYEGMHRNDKRNGYGIYWFANGETYDGEWTDDKMNGWGIYSWPGKGQYIGEFENNMKHGSGKLKLPNGLIRNNGLWENNKYKSKMRWLHLNL